MREFIYVLLVSVTIFLLATFVTADSPKQSRVQACTGECYEEYVRIHGTPAQIEQKKQEAAQSDPFSDLRPVWAGCAACHGTEGQGVGAFPVLAGQSKDYIIEALTIYKNRGQRGAQSALMWGQASVLSDQDIELIGEFVQEGFPK